jgi:outer membrane lipoprotein LolB
MQNKITLLFFFVLLSGCLPVKLIEPDEDVYAENNWLIKGRIGIQHENESYSASLIWRQQREKYRMRLIGPLGQGSLTISGSPEVAEVRYADGQTVRYAKPDGVFLESIGVSVPVAALRYWIMGKKAPFIESESSYNSDGLLSEIIQSGWQVNLYRYSQRSGANLPAKIIFEKAETEVRVVIKDWQFDFSQVLNDEL